MMKKSLKVIRTVSSFERYRQSLKPGKSLGFVPTMGYLHEGHLSLVKHCRRDCDIVAVSIYINPSQFGPAEDLAAYPRDLTRDKKLLTECGVDVLFLPDNSQMYRPGHETWVDNSGKADTLCGASRPGHFRGVLTVVLKLFNIIRPDKAYFGKKDYQQLILIKWMARDLNLPVKVIGCPVIRENSGLAMSSRNSYFSEPQREGASILRKLLAEIKNRSQQRPLNSEKILRIANKFKLLDKDLKIDYLDVVNKKTLDRLDRTNRGSIVLAAVFYHGTRLIDNIEI